jgi:hypothetical protein
VVTHVYAYAEQLPGLRFTYEPERLRFFLARFAPLSPFPELAIEGRETPLLAVGSAAK